MTAGNINPTRTFGTTTDGRGQPAPVTPNLKMSEHKKNLPDCARCDQPVAEGEERSSCAGTMHQSCFEEHQAGCAECRDDFA